MAQLPLRSSNTLVVVGTAPGAPAALRRYAEEFPRFDVAAVNAGGLFWEGPLKLWASYHSNKMPTYAFTRLSAKFPMDGITYVFDEPSEMENYVRAPFNGTSSMLAAWAGVLMDYPSIVLVGVELNEAPYAAYRQGWQEFARTSDAHRVKSLSGWTAELLGKPEGWKC